MIRKFHDAREEGRNEVDDLGHRRAAARVPARRRPRRRVRVPDAALRATAMHINVGTGEDLSIRELAEMVRASFTRRRRSSSTHRSPTARRASCSTSRGCTRSAGATASSLGEGIEHTYNWFLANHATARGICRRQSPRRRHVAARSIPTNAVARWIRSGRHRRRHVFRLAPRGRQAVWRRGAAQSRP